jgi:cell shape-determining protein MreC
MTEQDAPIESSGATRGGDRMRSLARPVLNVLDRRFDQLHRHLDGVAERLEHSDDLAELRQLFSDTLAELRVQSQATLELAQTLRSFAESLAIRLDAVAADLEQPERARPADS